MEEQELINPPPVSQNETGVDKEFNYELFSEFFEKYNSTQEEKDKLNKSILEYFKSDEFKKYKEEHSITKEDKENIKSIKDSLEFIVEDIKSKNLSDIERQKTYSETQVSLDEKILAMKEGIETTNNILYLIIVFIVFAWIFKLIWNCLSNVI